MVRWQWERARTWRPGSSPVEQAWTRDRWSWRTTAHGLSQPDPAVLNSDLIPESGKGWPYSEVVYVRQATRDSMPSSLESMQTLYRWAQGQGPAAASAGAATTKADAPGPAPAHPSLVFCARSVSSSSSMPSSSSRSSSISSSSSSNSSAASCSDSCSVVATPPPLLLPAPPPSAAATGAAAAAAAEPPAALGPASAADCRACCSANTACIQQHGPRWRSLAAARTGCTTALACRCPCIQQAQVPRVEHAASSLCPVKIHTSPSSPHASTSASARAAHPHLRLCASLLCLLVHLPLVGRAGAHVVLRHKALLLEDLPPCREHQAGW